MIAEVADSPRMVAKSGDERIRKMAASELLETLSVTCRRVQLEISDGSVTLKGTVRRYYDKQMAQEAVKRVDGVRLIRNELLVVAK